MSGQGQHATFPALSRMSVPGGRVDEISAKADIGRLVAPVAAAQCWRQRQQTKHARTLVLRETLIACRRGILYCVQFCLDARQLGRKLGRRHIIRRLVGLLHFIHEHAVELGNRAPRVAGPDLSE